MSSYGPNLCATGLRHTAAASNIREQTAWTAKNSGLGFLALDRNDNGMIDNGQELFGNNTHPGKHNGFMALMHDSTLLLGERTGSIELGHPLYEKLLLWTDKNHDGVSRADEIQKLSELYSGIGLGYRPNAYRDKHGNAYAFEAGATIRTAPGRNRPNTAAESYERVVSIYDVSFVTRR